MNKPLKWNKNKGKIVVIGFIYNEVKPAFRNTSELYYKLKKVSMVLFLSLHFFCLNSYLEYIFLKTNFYYFELYEVKFKLKLQ